MTYSISLKAYAELILFSVKFLQIQDQNIKITMNKYKLVFTTLVLLFSLTKASTDLVTLSQDQLSNPQFMKVINNYFGCKTWVDGVCIECSQNYFFNVKGICCEVKPECRLFNRNAGICESCYQGYELINGKCTQVNLVTSKDIGCRQWRNGVCSQCSVRWFFGPDGDCYPVDDNCRTWTSNGACQTCYNGYIVQNQRCILDPNQFVPAADSLCALWRDRICVQCSERAYFDINGICKQVDTQCNTWDPYDGFCLSCYKGYQLNNGACVLSQQKGPNDIGCKTWNWDTQKCLQCSIRWVFAQNGFCIPVGDSCSQFDSLGACTACYKGYELRSGDCVLSLQRGPTDLGCKNWDWDRQICLQCSARWVFSQSGLCVPVSDNCSQYDKDGFCTACYFGYFLNQGQCQIRNLLCKQRSNGLCTSCYNGYVLIRSQCVPLSNVASLAQYYAECCPQKLAMLREQNRIN